MNPVSSTLLAYMADIGNLEKLSGLFALPPKQRHKVLENFKYPTSLKEPLASLQTDELGPEIAAVGPWLKQPSADGLKNNRLITAVGHFFANDFGPLLDAIPLSFYALPEPQKLEHLPKLPEYSGVLSSTVRLVLLKQTYQEITEPIQKFLKLADANSLATVQLPKDISGQEKTGIRTRLRESISPWCFPVFTVNQALLGGVRIFRNGKLTDPSWAATINHLFGKISHI